MKYTSLFFLFACALSLLSSLSVQANSSNEASQCQSCHAAAVKDWQQSHHFHAMADINSASNLASFDGQTLLYQGQQARFYQQDGRYLVDMPELDGKQQTVELLYTFGYQPLQQFMFDFGKGHLQFIPFAWDSRPKADGGERWFVLYPDMQPTDEFHWSQKGQNWNQNCADCHSTAFEKNFDLSTLSYQSRYQQINVSCSACHGDSRGHLAWSQKPDSSTANAGFALSLKKQHAGFGYNNEGKLTALDNSQVNQQIQVCATCHSRRTQLSEGNATANDRLNFQQHFTPAFITPELYYTDGQIFDEDYVWGSFVQSKMFAQGVTCSNCHNPHSGELKLPGNQTCTQCHASDRYDVAAHHQHKTATAGSQCIDCHMPTTVYMQVDARHDHSFSVPNPLRSQEFSLPNACQACHQDKGDAWINSQYQQLFAAKLNDNAKLGYITAFSAVRDGNTAVAPLLHQVAADPALNPILRGTALHLLARQQNIESAQLKTQLNSKDELVRLGAADALAALPLAERWKLAKQLLQDDSERVRLSAAAQLAPMLKQGITADERRSLQQAFDAVLASLNYQADRGWAHTRMGDLYMQLQQPQQAIASYRKAIEVEPVFVPAYLNLADIYRAQSQDNLGSIVLQQALNKGLTAASLYQSMALLNIRQKQYQQAAKTLEKGLTLNPTDVNLLYTASLLHDNAGEVTQAVAKLKTAHELAPARLDILYALVAGYAKLKQYDAALHYTLLLRQLTGPDQQVDNMIQRLQMMSSMN